MRVAIVESQPHVRAALTFFLRQQPTVEVVGVFGPEPDLVARLLARRPEVVLLDWELPRHLASRILAAVKRVAPAPSIIALSKRLETEPHALAAGADAFICKGEAPEALLRALALPSAIGSG